MELPLPGKLRGAEDFGQPLNLGLRLADHEHFLSGAGRVQLVVDLAYLAAETLDRFDFQSAAPLQRAAGQRGCGHRREAKHPPHHRRNTVKILRPPEPLEVVASLLFQLARLDQQKPTLRRQEVGQVGPVLEVRLKNRHVDRIERGQASLTGDLEAADRLDLIAEQLDADRVVPVGCEDVDDAPADRELAGQLDRRGLVEAAQQQPLGEFLNACFATGPKRAGLPPQRLAVGNRLQDALDAGGHQLGRIAREQQLQQSHPVAEHLVVDHPFAGQ